MDYKSKFDKVLTTKGLRVYEAEKLLGFSPGTLQKAYNENRDLSKRLSKEFLKMFHVERLWWETGQGEIFSENSGSLLEESIPEYNKQNGSAVWMEKVINLQEKMLKDYEAEVKRLSKELEECRREKTRLG